ncbi:MAG: YtxH domain-containing protein [Haliscomenobacter sp.]|nr:YtxH domain-containing protein [Haliscomenobacter sp.]
MGILAGIATGALFGVLFAPGKGSSTRRKIAHGGEEYLNDMAEKFDDFIDGVTKKFESVKDEAVRMTENGKTKVDAAENKFAANIK